MLYCTEDKDLQRCLTNVEAEKNPKVQKASAINFNNMLQQCLNNHSADKRTFNIQDFCDLKNSKPKPCVATIGDLSRLKIPK